MKDLIREAGSSEMEMLDYISKKMPGDVIGAAPVEEIKGRISDRGAGSGHYLPGNQLYGSCERVCEIPERGILKAGEAIYFSSA